MVPQQLGSSVSTTTYLATPSVEVADRVEADRAAVLHGRAVGSEHVADVLRVAGRHFGQARQQPAVAHAALLHVQVGRAVGAEERAADVACRFRSATGWSTAMPVLAPG